jgi:hypothetical protein
MCRSGFVATLVSVLLAAGLLTSSADAATRQWDDARRDAMPALDISSLTLRNAEHRVRVTLRIPALERRRLGGVTVYLGRKVAGRPEYAASKVRRGDHWKKTWQELGDSRRRCSGLRIRIHRHRVVVSVPQRCLDDNRAAVRVQAAVFTRAYLRGDVPDEVILDPRPSPSLPIDGVPTVRGTRMTHWVGYR